MIKHTVLSGLIVEEEAIFTIDQLSHACGMSKEWILALVKEGVIEAVSYDQKHWRFRGYCLRRVRIVQRLESDLGLNLAGAALALELLDEVEALRNRIKFLEK